MAALTWNAENFFGSNSCKSSQLQLESPTGRLACRSQKHLSLTKKTYGWQRQALILFALNYIFFQVPFRLCLLLVKEMFEEVTFFQSEKCYRERIIVAGSWHPIHLSVPRRFSLEGTHKVWAGCRGGESFCATVSIWTVGELKASELVGALESFLGPAHDLAERETRSWFGQHTV